MNSDTSTTFSSPGDADTDYCSSSEPGPPTDSDTSTTLPFLSEEDSGYSDSSDADAVLPSSPDPDEFDALMRTPRPSGKIVQAVESLEKTPTQLSVSALKKKKSRESPLSKAAAIRKQFLTVKRPSPPRLSYASSVPVDSRLHVKWPIDVMLTAIRRRKSHIESDGSQGEVEEEKPSGIDLTKFLPENVLILIFESYVAMAQQLRHPDTRRFVVPSAKSGPTVLCQICTRWRWIGTTHPALWCSMAVDVLDQPHLGLLRTLKLWLFRSRDAPLSLRFRFDRTPEAEDLGYPKAAFKLLTEHGERWQDLDLQLDDVLGAVFCKALHFRKAFQLKRALVDLKSCSITVVALVLAALGTLPNLQELSYRGRSRKSLMPIILRSPVWWRLGFLDIGVILDRAECIIFLRQCTQASSIIFRSIANDDNINPMTPSPLNTVLPRLKALDFATAIVDVTCILEYFTFPGLTSLSLSTASTDPRSPVIRFGNFLKRSACPLLRLNIYDCEMAMETVIALIRAIATSGSGVGPRKMVKTLGIHSRLMPRDEEEFSLGLKVEEEANGAFGIDFAEIQFRLPYPYIANGRSRVGWGEAPMYL